MNPPPPLSVSRARCRNHADREAAARCPECSSFLCRECITEHRGRMICKSCLEPLLARTEKQAGRRLLGRALLWMAAFGGVFIAWSFFVLLGRLVLLLKDLLEAFHA